MPALCVTECFNLVTNGDLSLLACLKYYHPDELGFDGFGNGFDHGIILAIAFGANG